MRVVATEKTYTQGNLSQTGNPLDLAISGRGFFQVLLPDGTLAYTPRRRLPVNNQGQLVTSSGYVVQPGINIPQGAQSITIGADGVVSVQLAGQSAPTQVGTLQLADFVNPPACSRAARTCCRDRRQRHARSPARPASRASARWCRARSRARTSTWSRKW